LLAHHPCVHPRLRQRAEDRRRGRRDVSGALEQVRGSLDVVAPESALLGTCAEVELDRAWVGRPRLHRGTYRQRTSHALREPLADREHLAFTELHLFGPGLEAVGDRDKSGRQPQAGWRAAQRRRQHVGDAELGSDLARIDRRAACDARRAHT
jgi:hypothetical protein